MYDYTTFLFFLSSENYRMNITIRSFVGKVNICPRRVLAQRPKPEGGGTLGVPGCIPTRTKNIC